MENPEGSVSGNPVVLLAAGDGEDGAEVETGPNAGRDAQTANPIMSIAMTINIFFIFLTETN